MTGVATSTLADLVAANPAAARTLDRYGLDYCCNGEHSVADACAAAGLDPATVLAEVDALTIEDHPWTEMELTALAAHILEVHHEYLHEELPLLDALAAKVAEVHGGRHPELVEVRRLVRAVAEDLEPHMMKEERILFPAIQALAAGERDFPFGPIANPIRMMTMEHDSTGELLADLRATTTDYAVPDDGCASYQSLYQRLDALEADTKLHIHKENHLLFPAAVALAET